MSVTAAALILRSTPIRAYGGEGAKPEPAKPKPADKPADKTGDAPKPAP